MASKPESDDKRNYLLSTFADEPEEVHSIVGGFVPGFMLGFLWATPYQSAMFGIVVVVFASLYGIRKYGKATNKKLMDQMRSEAPYALAALPVGLMVGLSVANYFF